MKIRLVGAKFFHADGWTDGQTNMMKLIVAFRNFANMPEKGTMGLDCDEIDILGIKCAGTHLY
jgi:hypothetical protein